MDSFLLLLAMGFLLDIRWSPHRMAAEGSQAEVKCGFPGTPAGGDISSRMKSYPKGMEVKFNCNDGYERIGPDTSKCNEQGMWTNSLPLCEQNLAYKRSSNQSSTENSFSASLAIDDNPVTCAETKLNHNNMWWVYLDNSYKISKIKFKIAVANTRIPVNISVEVLKSSHNSSFQICRYYSKTGRAVYEEETACVNQYLSGDVVRIRDLRSAQAKLKLCDVKVYEKAEYDCGEPDVQPNCEVELNVESNKKKAIYRSTPGFQLIKGDMLRICSQGKWLGVAPLCLRAQLTEVSANISTASDESTSTSDKKDTMIIGIAIGVTAASISTIIVIVVIVVIMRKFYHKTPNQAGAISSQHDGIFLHANHSSCGSSSPTIPTTYSDPWDDPSKHTYDYINTDTLSADRLKREPSLKMKPHVDGTGYIMSSRRKGSHDTDPAVRESLLYPPVPLKPVQFERRPDLPLLHIPHHDNRTNSFNEIEVDAYDYSGGEDQSRM